MNDALKWRYDGQPQHRTNTTSRRIDSQATPRRPVMGNAPVLDTTRCTGCGACFDVCMFEAVAFDGAPSFDGARCEACGACIAMCPEDALSWPSFKR